MKLKSNQPKATAEQVVKDIRRATRRHYSTEDKIRIVLSGLRGEDSITDVGQFYKIDSHKRVDRSLTQSNFVNFI